MHYDNFTCNKAPILHHVQRAVGSSGRSVVQRRRKVDKEGIVFPSGLNRVASRRKLKKKEDLGEGKEVEEEVEEEEQRELRMRTAWLADVCLGFVKKERRREISRW